MKGAVLVCITIVAVFAIVFGSISYNVHTNRDKPHVFTAEEIFATECSKRGGNPTIKNGKDWEGEKSLDVKEYKCEGVNDVHN